MYFNKPYVKYLLTFGVGLFALFMFGLAVVGGVNSYSSVPFWDMWNGTLGFLLSIHNGDYISWLSQHNEHRILISRVLFWIDAQFFGGLSYFLVSLNYVITAAACCVYWLFIQRLSGSAHGVIPSRLPWMPQKIMLWSFIVAWLFLWTQRENFTWGFQSQFFLAQLLPLIALFLLASSKEYCSWSYFFWACIAGIASAGTMANGVLALPIMLVCALIARHGILQNSLLLVLAIAVNILYFYGYHSPAHHGHLSDELVNNPAGFLNYILFYLGSPFYYLFGEDVLGRGVATLAGATLVICSALIACREFLQRKRSAHIIALIFFIIYIGGTAFGTAGGRLKFGLDQALSLRYTTPAIMAWAALIVAYWGEARLRSNLVQQVLQVLMVVFALTVGSMLKYQFKALESTGDVLPSREIAALAATLGIKDDAYIQSVYPDSGAVLRISREAKALQYSIFGSYPFLRLDQEISTRYNVESVSTCLGSLDLLEPIEGVADYSRVHGWLFSMQTKSSPKLLRFVNRQGDIVGFGLTGFSRLDVAKLVHSNGHLSGFRGYILKSVKGSPVMIVGDDPHCSLDVKIPSI